MANIYLIILSFLFLNTFWLFSKPNCGFAPAVLQTDEVTRSFYNPTKIKNMLFVEECELRYNYHNIIYPN